MAVHDTGDTMRVPIDQTITFEDPAPPEASRINFLDDEPGPWFIAAYTGRCATCGEDIDPGDEIRANGAGGYECRECGDEEDE